MHEADKAAGAEGEGKVQREQRRGHVRVRRRKRQRAHDQDRVEQRYLAGERLELRPRQFGIVTRDAKPVARCLEKHLCRRPTWGKVELTPFPLRNGWRFEQQYEDR
jgi:hypothetical protein